MKNKFKKVILVSLDLFMFPFTYVSLLWLKFVRERIVGLWHSESSISLFLFKKVGVFPITDNFYEPLFNTETLNRSLRDDRELPGLQLNASHQVGLLKSFNYSSELLEISNLPVSELNYTFLKGAFLSGDSEILYSMIRYLKPKKIIEIGCGQSSLMIQHALKQNCHDDSNYTSEHICIEPYANGWLENLNAKVVRKKVEDVEISFFKSLNENDILFIDSSHIIRPQGDVLYEYLHILPSLNSGVYIHVHDIFTPKDYLNEWLLDGINFWNEQYLLEAFLSNNKDYQIALALNFLKHNYYEDLSSRCPMLTMDREPGSFWIQKKL
jgi:hypothetical protein